MPDRHIRGYVRSLEADPAPANPDQLRVELWLTDRRNVEQHVRWRASHYRSGELTTDLDMRPGDDVEVVLVADRRGEYKPTSYVDNHTRGVRYTLNKKRRRIWPFGC
jgi:hypothetical protein